MSIIPSTLIILLLCICLVLFESRCTARILKVDPVEDVLYEACNHQATISYEKVSRLLAKFENANQESRDKLLESFLYDESALMHWSNITSILSSFEWIEYKEKWRNLLINRMARIHVDDVPLFITKLADNSNEKMTLLSQIKQKINHLTREKKHSISLKIFGIEARAARKASLMLDDFTPDCVFEDLDEDNIVIAIGFERSETPKPLGKYTNSTSFEALKMSTIHALRRLKQNQKFGVVFLTSKVESIFESNSLVQATKDNIKKAVDSVEAFQYKAATGLFLENLVSFFQQDANPKSALYIVGTITETNVAAFNVGSHMGKLKRSVAIMPKINTVGFFVNDPSSIESMRSVTKIYNQYSTNTGGKSIRLFTPQV